MAQSIESIMTSKVRVVQAGDSLREAAHWMNELGVGSLPVVQGQQLAGMITDRDITVRATAQGLNPDDTRVSEVMSEDVKSCQQDQSVSKVMQMMGDLQLRRLPVVDNQGQLVGIVSLGDLATRQEALELDPMVREISTPVPLQMA